MRSLTPRLRASSRPPSPGGVGPLAFGVDAPDRAGVLVPDSPPAAEAVELPRDSIGGGETSIGGGGGGGGGGPEAALTRPTKMMKNIRNVCTASTIDTIVAYDTIAARNPKEPSHICNNMQKSYGKTFTLDTTKRR